MDNNKDRKFYWEVKDFMSKKHEPKTSTPSSSLKDSIKTVLEQNNSYVQKTFNKHSEAVNAGSNFIGKSSEAQIGYNTNCPAYTKNKDVNDFNVNKSIMEQVAPGFGQQRGMGGGGRQSWRERNPEAYAKNVAAQQELEAKRAQNIAASRRRRAEDEAYEYNQEQGTAAQGPTPTGGNISTQLEMDPNDPTMPIDSPENRAKLKTFRQQRELEKKSEYMSGRMQELAAKDPSSLTSSEAAELSLFKSMTQGKVATKGLEGKVKEKLISSEIEAAGAAGIMGPTPGGGNLATEVGTQTAKAKDVYGRTLGRSQADLVGQTQAKGREEAEAKAQEQAAYDARLASERYAKMQNEIIQGTNMTYGQFKQQYGRDYDARNPEDSSMLVRAASNRAAFRVSPTAKALDQTTVDFNRNYRDINAANAARQGQLDRRVDAAQRDLDQFNADRKGTVQREIAAIQAQPGFVASVAQSMNQALPAKNNIPPYLLRRPTAAKTQSASQTSPKTYRI
jgi:hypothetical protein